MKSKREKWIDILRFLSIISVVMLHVIGNTINTFGLTGTPNKVYTILIGIINACIPIFVMISGYLLLNPKKELSYKDILKKYVLKAVLALIVFGSVFIALEEIFTYKAISINIIPKIILGLINGEVWAHMWYLYMLITLYLLTPLIRRVVSTDKKELKYILIILFLLSILIPTLNEIPKINMTLYISCSSYVFYYILGYYLGNYDQSKKVRYSLYIASIISIAFVIVANIFESSIVSPTYNALHLLPIGVGVFVLVKNIFKNRESSNLLETIGNCSLGIYILHQFFINVVFKLLKLKWIVIHPYIGLLIYSFLIFLLTFMVVYIMKKIKVFDKIV